MLKGLGRDLHSPNMVRRHSGAACCARIHAGCHPLGTGYMRAQQAAPVGLLDVYGISKLHSWAYELYLGPECRAREPTGPFRAQQALLRFAGCSKLCTKPFECIWVPQATLESPRNIIGCSKRCPSPYCMYTSAESRARVLTVCIRAQEAAHESLLYVYGRSKLPSSVYEPYSGAASRTRVSFLSAARRA